VAESAVAGVRLEQLAANAERFVRESFYTERQVTR
jgi:hypothetical protein